MTIKKIYPIVLDTSYPIVHNADYRVSKRAIMAVMKKSQKALLIYALRQPRGWQVRLAKEMGVAQSSISCWFNGKVIVPALHAPKLAKITGIPANELCPKLKIIA